MIFMIFICVLTFTETDQSNTGHQFGQSQLSQSNATSNGKNRRAL